MESVKVEDIQSAVGELVIQMGNTAMETIIYFVVDGRKIRVRNCAAVGLSCDAEKGGRYSANIRVFPIEIF